MAFPRAVVSLLALQGLLNPEAKIVNHPLRRPRNWRLWKTLIVLADELRISQSLSDNAAHDLNKPTSVIVLALVESERLLVQIAEQMKRLNVHIRPVDSALKQRPKVFQSVGMDAPFHVALGMIDELVGVFVRQAHVGKMLVCENFRAFLDVLAHLR